MARMALAEVFAADEVVVIHVMNRSETLLSPRRRSGRRQELQPSQAVD